MYSFASQCHPAVLDLQPHTACDLSRIRSSLVQQDLSRIALEALKLESGELLSNQKTNRADEFKTASFEASVDAGFGTLQKSHDAVKIVGRLKACAAQKDLHTGSIIHDEISKSDLLEENVFVGNAVVNMYAKCGALGRAQDVFDKLPTHDVVSWNTLIAGYTQHGHGREALHCFGQMLAKGFSPTAITMVCILKACGSVGLLDKGQQIHATIMKEGLLERDIMVSNALLDMYVSCGLLERAQQAFDDLQFVDVVSWNTLIAGYAHFELGDEAFHCFDQMKLEGFFPSIVTLTCVLKACGSTRASFKGQKLHAEIVVEGMLEKDLGVGTALVDMYVKCGMLAEAQDVFQDLPVKDVVLWTALITGYAQHEDGEQALDCFECMQLGGFSPNAVTFAGVLKACGSLGALSKGQDIHSKALRQGLLKRDLVVTCALVDMYAKMGMLQTAQQLFDEAGDRDVLLWNALIGGYAQHEHDEKALDYFEEMQLEGFLPDAVTFSCVLKACGSLGAAYQGQELYTEMAKDGYAERDTMVGTALVDMYANCGMLTEAQDVFDKLAVQDKVAWNALLVGYAQLGVDENVSSLFKKMMKEGQQPNQVTFVIVLNACSHRGLVDMGELCFEMSSRSFGIIPTLELCSCMIDLFGRAGQLDKALAVMERLQFPTSPTMWHTFLGACLKWGHINLGKWACQHALELNANDGAAYICMNNMHAAACMEEDSIDEKF